MKPTETFPKSIPKRIPRTTLVDGAQLSAVTLWSFLPLY